MRDFSGVQGKRGWHWQSHAPGDGYRNLRYAAIPDDPAATQVWLRQTHANPFPVLVQGALAGANSETAYLHARPGDATRQGDAVIAWQAPAAGTIEVAGEVHAREFNGWGGTDGFHARLLIAGKDAWRADFPDGEHSEAIPRTVLPVAAGEFVRLHIGAKEEAAYDNAWVRLRITLTPATDGPR